MGGASERRLERELTLSFFPSLRLGNHHAGCYTNRGKLHKEGETRVGGFVFVPWRNLRAPVGQTWAGVTSANPDVCSRCMASLNAALCASWPLHQQPQHRGLTHSSSASNAALNTGTFERICAVVFGPKVWSGQWFTTVLFQPRCSRASPKITRATGSGFQVP